MSRPFPSRFLFVPAWALVFALPAQAQSRFTLRAEPDVIPAGGIATTSIFVQVPQRGAISQNGIVRFATTAGVIESQAQLSGGVARVLLRSAPQSGTAVVTAFVGNTREAITVEFSDEATVAERFLQVSAPYAAYGQNENQITTAGRSVLEFGELRIESDVRLDVDLYAERVWAQGNKGGITISHGRGDKAKKLVGDRLFYDLRRRRGVIRRAEGDLTNSETGARQEFSGTQFLAPPTTPESADEKTSTPLLAPQAATAPLPARDGVETSPTARENAEEGAVISPDPLGEGLPQVAPSAPEETDETVEREPENAAPETVAPQTVAPGSLADTPAAIEGEGAGQTRISSLVAQPRTDDEATLSPSVPAYSEIGPAKTGYEPRIVELPAPSFETGTGYWVTARRLRVFPRDEVQFERARIFFNGKKAFSAPIYVLPLDGTFNPTTDMFAFNSSGGLGVKIPIYYQANERGTGNFTLRNEPSGGFGAANSGPSLEVKHQYWLSNRSQGQVGVDSIGNGAWNLNASHRLELSNKTTANFYLNMPRHRDLFARASLAHDLANAQIGLEAFFDRPENTKENLRGQFFARMRPRALGRSGWTSSVAFNALAVQNSPFTRVVLDSGGGVGIPGQGGGGGTRIETNYRRLFGQQLTANLQSPTFSPYRGAAFSANLFTTAFNYSDGRRGLSPGMNLTFSQSLGKRADLRLDYTYDRSNLGLYGATSDSFTHYASASLAVQVAENVGFSTFLSRSLRDGSMYGNADLSVAFAKRWRAGVFSDFSTFNTDGRELNYGLTLARSVGNREVSVNWDALRGKVYLELGSRVY